MEKVTHEYQRISHEWRRILLCVAISLLFVAIGGAKTASAASLYFSPSSGSYAVGSVVTANVYVSSADQAMNAASGIVSFPQDKLEVTSLSKSGSIFALWVQEPSFSNRTGAVNFEGIVLNPGFIGASGKIIAVNFRVKAAGTALVNFSSGSALANDGKGTNILASLGKAEFSLGGAAPKVSGLPLSPAISSPTHPDTGKWYARKDAKFVWSVSPDITAVRILVSKLPRANPTVAYASATREKEIKNLEDGVWYFHAQFRNANGWGEVSRFRFQIDTTPPEKVSIKFIDKKETDDPRPTALFDTTDALSGIDYYRLKIGEGDFYTIKFEAEVESNPYTLPYQAPGTRILIVQAFDRAGNSTAASETFIVKPLPLPSAMTGLKITNMLVIIIPLTAFIAVLLFILGYGWRKFLRTKNRLRKEVREAESALHKAFDLLKESIREQIKILEKTGTKRQLTKEEEKILKQLESNLDDAEKFIRKEIEDIEEEVK